MITEHSSSSLTVVVKSLGARALTLPLALLAALLSVRLLVDELDVQGYALYALIATLPALLPLSDLGLGAAVTDAVARRAVLGPARVHRVVSAVFWRLVVIASVLAAVAVTLGLSGSWQMLLGVQAGTEVELAGTAAFVAFSLSIPVAVSFRVLQGGGLNHHVVSLQGGTSVVLLGLVGGSVLLSAPAWVYPAAPGIAAAVTGSVGLVIARRRGLLPVGSLLKRPLWSSSASLWRTALPMLVISIALPMTFHSARVILSHQSTLDEVAAYSIAFQLYVPLLSLVSASGQSLWPVYAASRDHDGTARSDFDRITALFAASGLVLATALLFAAPLATPLLTGGRIEGSSLLTLLFAGLLLTQALQYPAGMLLTDESGLRLQAAGCAAMTVVAVGLSILAADALGAVGPVLAALVAFSVFMVVPTLRRARATCSSHHQRGVTARAPAPGEG